MARRPRQDRLEDIYAAVQQYPGKRPGFIALLLGLHRSDITRSLPNLEERGLYLSEDERGGLWAWLRKKK